MPIVIFTELNTRIKFSFNLKIFYLYFLFLIIPPSSGLIEVMNILGIETSCDETALALIEANGDKNNPEFNVVDTALNSQIEKHREFGGVFPSLAKREHALNIVPLLEEIAKEQDWKVSDSKNKILNQVQDDNTLAELEKILEREPDLFEKLITFLEKYEKPEIDLISVTSGPGLEPALWVGINFARALSLAWDIPVIPANHMEGHIVSVLLENDSVEFPAISLLISGGHTELVSIKDWGEYEVIGQTRDDAVGEAYDKVARILGLPYPGGPEISKLAGEARQLNLSDDSIEFPRPMLHSDDFDFSLSGLKTAVLYKTQKIEDLNDEKKKIVANEFEKAVVDVLTLKTKKALIKYGAKTLLVGGGVIANEYIRENLTEVTKELDVKALFPTKGLSTDNAIMIAMAGYFNTFHTKAVVNPIIEAKGNLSF
jgi:N6-L-threonylcarbamoyladenine synthase